MLTRRDYFENVRFDRWMEPAIDASHSFKDKVWLAYNSSRE